MGISAGTSNWLWVRSRGICAHPTCSAALVKLDGTKLVTQGQRAHIRSDVPDGPRYDADYADPDQYENLLLLCRDHHNLVDSQPSEYPVEELERWKRDHEGPGYGSHPVLVPPPPVGAHYVRRDDPFARLAVALEAHGRTVLVGLSGAGKTQLAADYFRSVVDGYSLRLWVRARDAETLLEDFARAGPYLGVPHHDDESLLEYCRRIREVFETTPGWLIVFDDAPDEPSVHDLMPGSGGHVVVTSQAQAWPTVTTAVGALSRTESLEMLRGHPRLTTAEPVVLNHLADAAGDLPLCLMQVMGYLDATGSGPNDLLRLFADRRAMLLDRGAPPDHLAMRVSVSSAIDRLTASAKQLLAALSVLASVPVPIPEALVPREPHGLLGPLADSLALEDAISELRQFSLLERDHDRMSCHEITQLLTRDLLTQEEVRQATLRALALMGELLPARVDRQDHLPAALALLPHVNAVVSRVGEYPGIGIITATLVNRLAPAYNLMGEGARAEAEFRRALVLLDREVEDDVGLRASILHNLSNSARDNGDFPRAIELAQEALDLKRECGAPPVSVATSMGTLGLHFEAIGEFGEALTLHRRALDLLEPAAHVRNTADALNDVARVLRRLDRHDESGSLSQQAVHLASTDPDAWSELAEANLNLAVLSEDQDPIQALEYAEAAVEACQSGGTLSGVLSRSLGSRGRLRCNVGDCSGISDLRLAVELLERFEGVGDNYARALGNLGGALVTVGISSQNQRAVAEGLAYLQRSRDVLVEALPANSPTVQVAEEMLRDALELVELARRDMG